MNVYEKINEVKKVVKNFTKDAETTGTGAYSYTSGNQILNAIKSKMEEIGLLLLPVSIEPISHETFNYFNSYGKEKTDFIVNGKIVYEWININDPQDRQRVDFSYYGQQNDISKAFGSGLTYSERYLLLKSLGIPTDEDDPDKKTEDKPKSKINQTTTNTSSNSTENKSKWVIVNNLIKGSGITLARVNEWIKNKYKEAIKINDLTDEQFSCLINSLKKQIEAGAKNE